MWQTIIKPIDTFIDSISMYRLLLYYLLLLLVATIGLSAIGDLHYNALYIAISAVTLVVACWIINKIFAYIFDAPTNPESSILTALILALIIPPTPTGFGFLFLLAAAGLAIASKYLITIRYKHIFNPAAIAVVLTAIGPRQNASWWVGTAVLLPFVIVGGVLLARKVRREHMVITFLIVTIVATSIFSVLGKTSVVTSLHDLVFSSAVFFLAFVMLTEPYTSPATRGRQLWYAAIVGVIVAPQFHILHIYSTPELALIIGNVFAYVVSSKTKLFPIMREKLQVATNTMDFVFIPRQKFKYKPGQYMEWTLQHTGTDSRGSRRYFTLASSPTESNVRIGVKFYKEGSTYKRAMLKMDQNTAIVASQLAGDFVMPRDKRKKLAFIAGGIGITPFRSMAKYMIDKHENRSVTMLYGARSQSDLAYVPLFEEARQSIGMKTIYAVSGAGSHQDQKPYTHPGNITAGLIKSEIPDFAERIFYLSGTHAMVEDVQALLENIGVAKHNIKIDFFPGYA